MILSFEEDAEQKCEFYIEKALELNEKDFNANTTLGSLKISQNKREEARDILLKTLDYINEEVEINSLINISKLLIEVELFDDATKVLKFIQEQNEVNFDVWYLYGLAYYLKGEKKDDKEADWEDSFQCLTTALKVAYCAYH